MTAQQSFEDWWEARGSRLYPPTMKAGLWIVFADGWHRATKAKETPK